MRFVLAGVVASALVGAPAQADSAPPAGWLAQAMCIHRHEGPWAANTGNGYFGGMQIMPATWRRVNGPKQAAFAHPGDPAYPFQATTKQQLHIAWLIWMRDGRTWRSWGAVGAACVAASLPSP